MYFFTFLPPPLYEISSRAISISMQQGSISTRKKSSLFSRFRMKYEIWISGNYFSRGGCFSISVFFLLQCYFLIIKVLIQRSCTPHIFKDVSQTCFCCDVHVSSVDFRVAYLNSIFYKSTKSHSFFYMNTIYWF